jgi:hypothetical protein
VHTARGEAAHSTTHPLLYFNPPCLWCPLHPAGAMSVVMFVAFCPTMIGLHLSESPSTLQRAGLYSLFVFGIIMSIAGFYFTDNNSDVLVQQCRVQM